MTTRIRYIDGQPIEKELSFCESLVWQLGVFTRDFTAAVANSKDSNILYTCVNEALTSFVREIELLAKKNGLELLQDDDFDDEDDTVDDADENGSILVAKGPVEFHDIDELVKDVNQIRSISLDSADRLDKMDDHLKLSEMKLASVMNVTLEYCTKVDKLNDASVHVLQSIDTLKKDSLAFNEKFENIENNITNMKSEFDKIIDNAADCYSENATSVFIVGNSLGSLREHIKSLEEKQANLRKNYILVTDRLKVVEDANKRFNDGVNCGSDECIKSMYHHVENLQSDIESKINDIESVKDNIKKITFNIHNTDNNISCLLERVVKVEQFVKGFGLSFLSKI
jgi:uncharacterized coiled-coil DUF342 family protein